jgi:hypothetical protein
MLGDLSVLLRAHVPAALVFLVVICGVLVQLQPSLCLGPFLFEVIYGCPPRHLGLDITAASEVPSLSDRLHERDVMHNLIQQHLLRAQEHMKRDKH